MAEVEEKVVMTPKSKTANSTTLVIERKAVEPEASDKIHVAGGDHTGIIINKEKNYGKLIIFFKLNNLTCFGPSLGSALRVLFHFTACH